MSAGGDFHDIESAWGGRSYTELHWTRRHLSAVPRGNSNLKAMACLCRLLCLEYILRHYTTSFWGIFAITPPYCGTPGQWSESSCRGQKRSAATCSRLLAAARPGTLCRLTLLKLFRSIRLRRLENQKERRELARLSKTKQHFFLEEHRFDVIPLPCGGRTHGSPRYPDTRDFIPPCHS